MTTFLCPRDIFSIAAAVLTAAMGVLLLLLMFSAIYGADAAIATAGSTVSDGYGVYGVMMPNGTVLYPARAPCGCAAAGPNGTIDQCGFVNGSAGPAPSPNVTSDASVVCSSCGSSGGGGGGGVQFPDHCGVCGGCQLPFVTSNVTVMRAGGGLVTGNRLGSVAAVATVNVACGQYHAALLAPSVPSGVWTFSQEPLPAPPMTWAEYKLTQPYAGALGHAADASDDFLIVGDPLMPDPKRAHFYGRLAPPAFPPFRWFFDLADPCSGNQYGWDVAVDQESGFIAVTDPKAYFNGTVWMYRVTAPDLFQNITLPGSRRGDRFGFSVDVGGGHMAVGRPGCQDGLSGAGCLHFYAFDGTMWVRNTNVVGAPSPAANDGLGWRVSTDGNWTAAGLRVGGRVLLYRRSGAASWAYHSSITAPGLSANNKFGYSLQIRNGTLAVGDENYVASPTARGRVFTYRLQGNAWQLWSSYADADDSFNTRFGAALDLSDRYLIVGIPGADPFGECMVIDRNVSGCYGCDDVYNSCKLWDACGVCGGNATTCLGCDGVPNSGKVNDSCGVCGGHNATCIIIKPFDTVACNDSPNNVTVRTVTFATQYNTTLPLNFTVWSVTPPEALGGNGIFSLNITSGQFNFTPPVLFEGPVVVNVTACYVQRAAVQPAACLRDTVAGFFRPCPAYVPPGPVIVCNSTNVTLLVQNCTDCAGTPGGKLLNDSCGVCGGDNSTCSGCDGVPNSNATLDYCGACRTPAASASGVANCTCLDILVPPLAPGPCHPFYLIQLAAAPAGKPIAWSITIPPSYGSAAINSATGAVAYTPPTSMMGVGPVDTLTVRAVSTSCVPIVVATATVTVPMALFAVDACGVCGGDGSSCAGCDGVPGSGLILDACNVCGGDGTSCIVAPDRGCDWVCIGIPLLPWLLVALIATTVMGLWRYVRSAARRRMAAVANEVDNAGFVSVWARTPDGRPYTRGDMSRDTLVF